MFERRAYDKWQSYGQSKTANVLFSVGLEQRFGGKGIHAYAVHPGGIATNLGRHLSEQDIAMLRARIGDEEGANSRWKSIPQGAATTCWAGYRRCRS
jgi:NAD(P)-dependent dehydrogenase (short-subunit alcohol dehydrogenase family)